MMKTDRKSNRSHWTSGIDEMSDQLSGVPQVLFASDFDGTLSPIVDQPQKAELEDSAPAVLKKLGRSFPKVRLAFLSGRSVDDLAPRLGSASRNAILAGNHGLEIRGQGLDWSYPVLALIRPRLEFLIDHLKILSRGIPGLEIEDKGASITLHYRRMDESHLPHLVRLIAGIDVPGELRIHEGKKVFEFRPKVEWNKGFAIRKILRYLDLADSAVIFLGDDITDEDVFAELSDEAITVHVGSLEESSAAKWSAHDPADAVRFLNELSERLFRPNDESDKQRA